MLYVKTFNLIFCRTDFYWARAMGFAGQQLDDGDGVSVGRQQHYCVNNIYISQFYSNQAQPLNQLLSTNTWMGGAGITSLLVRVSSIILTPSPLCPLCRRGSRDRAQPPGCPAGPQRDDPWGLMDFNIFYRMLYLKCI